LFASRFLLSARRVPLLQEHPDHVLLLNWFSRGSTGSPKSAAHFSGCVSILEAATGDLDRLLFDFQSGSPSSSGFHRARDFSVFPIFSLPPFLFVRSISSSVCFSVGVSLRGLWLPARSVPAVDFPAGPVFGFSFHAGAATTLLRVGSPADRPLQL
jgi:hypothetical protein